MVPKYIKNNGDMPTKIVYEKEEICDRFKPVQYLEEVLKF